MNADAMTMIIDAGLTVTVDGNWEWISGDTYQFRDMLKKLGCRWSRKRQAWYLKPDAEKIVDFQEAKTEHYFQKEFHNELSDGYMGAIRSDGSKSKLHLHGAELSKAIRNDLRDNITELKRSAINVSCHTYSGGQHVYVTLTMEREKYFKGHDEFVENAVEHYFEMFSNGWVSYEDNYGQVTTVSSDYVYSDEFKTAEEQNAFKRKVVEYSYKSMVAGVEKYKVSEYHLEWDSMYMNEAAIRILERVFQIIRSYNYDDSNSMVDYFDTNFYWDVDVKLV